VDLIQLLTLLILAGICGSIAAWIVGYTPGGLLMSIIVGVIGAYLGGGLSSLLPFEIPIVSLFTIEIGTNGVNTIRFNLIWAIAGSVVLLLLLHTLRGGERRRMFGRR
jgi:uncharacterized membrane protein YeaQ/YmgE (transglycosylase-associated protein family)